MKLKKIVSIISAGILTLSMVGCSSTKNDDSVSSSQADGKTTIKFINGFTGGDGEYMKRITDAFNESQDQYFIEELQDKDHYTKFKTDNYDLVVMHGNTLPTYQQDGLLREMDDIYESAGLSIDDFHEVASDLVTVDSKKYGIPLDIHPLTMFYNKEMVNEEPKTYSDLVNINKELQDEDSNLYATGVPATGLVEYLMTTIAAQNNINLVEDNHLKFDTDEFADALMIYHDMIWKDKISPSGLGLDGEFQAFMKEAEGNASVQTAVSLTGPWYYSALKEKYGDNLGIGSIPTLGENQGVSGNSHLISVSSKVEDEAKIAGISEFIKFLYTPENLLNWAESGQAPLHLDTIKEIEANQDKYELAYYNKQQFDSYTQVPAVYQFGEQMRYMNENVFQLLVTTENLTKEQLMSELTMATEMAKQIADMQQ